MGGNNGDWGGPVGEDIPERERVDLSIEEHLRFVPLAADAAGDGPVPVVEVPPPTRQNYPAQFAVVAGLALAALILLAGVLWETFGVKP